MQNNDRYSKYIAIIALLISIVGVSLGFAAFSDVVQINAAADYIHDGTHDPIAQLSTTSRWSKEGRRGR